MAEILTSGPSEAGFYWFMGSIRGALGFYEEVWPTVVRVVMSKSMESVFKRVFIFGQEDSLSVSDFKGEFIGPIKSPFKT